jgi:hypothetical protein
MGVLIEEYQDDFFALCNNFDSIYASFNNGKVEPVFSSLNNF